MRELWTELDDRVLRYDGVSIIEPDRLVELLFRGLQPAQLRLTELSEDAVSFNAAVSTAEQLKELGNEPVNLSFSWRLPPEYLQLDVAEHVQTVFGERFHELAYDATQEEAAFNRVALELSEFERRGLTDLLRVIIYVLARFRETGQVYGVGRGSSCASFVLFLLGLHVVDPIKFNVPLEEFMHD